MYKSTLPVTWSQRLRHIFLPESLPAALPAAAPVRPAQRCCLLLYCLAAGGPSGTPQCLTHCRKGPVSHPLPACNRITVMHHVQQSGVGAQQREANTFAPPQGTTHHSKGPHTRTQTKHCRFILGANYMSQHLTQAANTSNTPCAKHLLNLCGEAHTMSAARQPTFANCGSSGSMLRKSAR